jgi:hypothetical protein
VYGWMTESYQTEEHGYELKCAVEYVNAQQTLLQGMGGDVHPCHQIPTRIHNGTDGRKSEHSDGNLQAISNTSEQVDPVYTPHSGLDQHKIALRGSIREPVDIRARGKGPGYDCKRAPLF